LAVSLLHKIKKMIQRIQSVYLALAALAATVLLIPFNNFPLVKFYGDTVALHFHTIRIENLVPGESSPFNAYFNWPMVAVVFLIIVFSTASIFLYKNRANQLRWIAIDIVLNLLVLAGFFFLYIPFLEKELQAMPIYQFTAFLPAVSLFFLILAFAAIKKDDKFVKSMDRIR